MKAPRNAQPQRAQDLGFQLLGFSSAGVKPPNIVSRPISSLHGHVLRKSPNINVSNLGGHTPI